MSRSPAPLAAVLAALTLMPADTARGDGAPAVAEIVTFRLAPGTSEAAFLAAARATGPLAARQPGFLSRTLSQGADGRWTDHVLWSSAAAAEAAATAVMADPAFAPFLSAIDPAGMEMRHEAAIPLAGR